MGTISVVLTTYNGTRYLREQLDSIREQTLAPDEVIILDDCSSDGTPDMVRQYMEEHHLANWRLIENETNLGWRRNFHKGFDLAQGDLVFPADQDDIWHPDKIERMTQIMEEHPEIRVLASNYHLFATGRDRRIGVYDHEMHNDGSLEHLTIRPRWYYVVRPGCTYCYRRSFYQEIAPRWNDQYAHDAILWRFATMRGGLYRWNEALIKFRRHGDNATSTFVWTRQNRLDAIDGYLWFHEEALRVCGREDREILERVMAFLRLRKAVLEHRSIRGWLRLLIRYGDYYNTRLGAFADFVYAFL